MQTFSTLIATSTPPPSAHLYLAQLSDDDPHQALRHFQAAIDLLNHQLKGKSPASLGKDVTNEDEIRQNIVRALVGQVELWMDPSYDLWWGSLNFCPDMGTQLISASTQRPKKHAKNCLRLLSKLYLGTGKLFKRCRLLGCHSNVQTMLKHVWRRHGQCGKILTPVSFTC